MHRRLWVKPGIRGFLGEHNQLLVPTQTQMSGSIPKPCYPSLAASAAEPACLLPSLLSKPLTSLSRTKGNRDGCPWGS